MNLKTGLALNQHNALNSLKTDKTASTFNFEHKSFSPQYPIVISLCTTMSEKPIFNYMKDDSALKIFSWETDEIKWVTRKIICTLILANDPEEIIFLKTKRWSWHFGEENLVLKSICGITITEQLHLKTSRGHCSWITAWESSNTEMGTSKTSCYANWTLKQCNIVSLYWRSWSHDIVYSSTDSFEKPKYLKL